MQFPWDENYKKGKAEHKVDTKEDIERAKRFRDKFEKILIDEQKKEQESQK
jgi:spore coat polysaccharide biosynthesis protein SpsF (cytidylyltransferase family)